jgi:hypothetical protein
MKKKRLLTGRDMGLDQYAYIASKANTEWDDSSRQDVSYWRKHPNLQGWMEKLAQEKGVQYDTFNGVELELTWEDIDKLEKDIKSGQVSELGTTGFFFGDPSDEHYREQDLEFCVNAKAELFLKRKVFYNSSW